MPTHTCQMFLEINRQLPDETNDLGEYIYNDEVYKAYCPRNELTGDHTCNSNIERINAGCILLLNMLFNIDDDILESENQDTSFAQYIILWLNHKLQQLPKSELIDLNNFYDKYIKDNEWYASFISEIDTQKELMNVDATMLSDLYYIFKEMCNKFSNTENHEDFTAYFYNNNNNNFVKTYEKLVTQFSASTMCSSYYTLLNDFKSSYEYFKDGHKDINLPELSCLKDIKEISKPNLEISDSQDSTDGNPESQDGGSENSNGTENSDQITPTNELGQQIEETKEDAIQSIYIDGSDVALPDLEDDLLYLNNETSKFYSNPPVYLDGFTVLDDESHVFMDDIEALDDEYPDNGIGGFKVNIDFLSIDDEFPNYDMVSSPLNIGLENNEIIVEDFETPQQPHQINTLIFDDPFENPKDFPDSIMCKLRGPKSVYCNRIICNKIKIGVIALSIPIILVFIYKYFPWKRTKKPKKTKKMKRVVNLLDRKKTKKIDINSIDGKKTIQITINSNDKKKETKKIISSDNGKTTLLFNIYKQMQLSPMPFIHLFMLLIFFIFKRKKDSIE
ncbi:CIR protein [Plasmodium chabaudi chabaudi]|uniref:CIR protein n=1 Tax=Plasmodium chabaudi chabaudi TaxID=31271 RepID=A0A4V0K298_PLACU|nr:CIR protein [Plasmodium chabaudi chabaudi]VTZ66934.1 CIR protein [Plasmodium chabaudi chabaudi]|eukprot:XP_016653139.1 CIR protein [Plasmodium chabaudi chabaudi]